MPDSGISSDLVNKIENYIAEILNGREATNEMEIFIRGQQRRGYITVAEAEELIDQVDIIRLALQRGQWFGKKARKRPEII